MSKIYPAIDIIDGQCVRLIEGDEHQKTSYSLGPLEMAQKYETAGAKYIHIVDLDAALAKRDNTALIYEICQETNLQVELGGGLKTQEQVEKAFLMGVERVIIGSLAVRNPELVHTWLKKYGEEKIVVGADVMNEQVMIDGWKTDSGKNIIDFIRTYMAFGAKKFLVTDISKDGKLGGSSIDLYKKLLEVFPNTDFIASGGVCSLDEIIVLEEMGMEGIIIGKAIFENAISLDKIFYR